MPKKRKARHTQASTVLLVDDGTTRQLAAAAGTATLLFDGYHLHWRQDGRTTRYSAFSGLADESAGESARDAGPTPQGFYAIDPDRIESPTPNANDWGRYRVPLEPERPTVRRMTDCFGFVRHSMYVHGGAEAGTIGCIEIVNDTEEKDFFERLERYGRKIALEVHYTGRRESKYEEPACPYPPSGATEGLEIAGLRRNPIADRILAECAVAFPANSADCNLLLKAVAATFFEPDLFSGPGMNADAVVVEMRGSKDWQSLGFSHDGAIRDAVAGRFVVAGMTSSELASAHGHLAVIVGDPGQQSGNVVVPICYAGSLSAAARVQRKRVSETFGAKPARERRISYFSREVQVVPESTPIARLVDFLAGTQPLLLSALAPPIRQPRKRKAPPSHRKAPVAKRSRSSSRGRPRPRQR